MDEPHSVSHASDEITRCDLDAPFRICEEIRVRAAALRLAVIDDVVIAEGTFNVAQRDHGWVDA